MNPPKNEPDSNFVIYSRGECLKRWGSKNFMAGRASQILTADTIDFRMDNIMLADVQVGQMKKMFADFDLALDTYGNELLVTGNMERHNIYKLFGTSARKYNLKLPQLLKLWEEWFYFSVELPSSAKPDEIETDENPT